MNTFFRICVMFTLLMLTFSLAINFLVSLGAFPFVTGIGPSGVDNPEDVLSSFTSLSDPTMMGIFLGATTLAFIGAVVLAAMTHSIAPIGIHLFGTVFWGSWINMNSILSYGGYVPVEFLLIFTVGVMFVFIGAVIGMLTGSG